MNPLESWLATATCKLSSASAARVRSEIADHYQASLDEGRSPAQAIDALGDPLAANRQYRKVLLTSAEARVLNQAKWEASAVCSRRAYLFIVPAIALWGAVRFLPTDLYLGLALLLAALGIGFLLTAPSLPLFTPRRARFVRAVRWCWLAALVILPMAPHVWQNSWLIFTCAWPIVWIEMRMHSIRRKLPASQWPKALMF